MSKLKSYEKRSRKLKKKQKRRSGKPRRKKSVWLKLLKKRLKRQFANNNSKAKNITTTIHNMRGPWKGWRIHKLKFLENQIHLVRLLLQQMPPRKQVPRLLQQAHRNQLSGCEQR